MLFKDLLGKKTLFFDGAMGTMLQAAGLNRVSCRNCGTSAMPVKLKKSTPLIKRRCGYYKNKYFWRKPP